jgi:acyl dehydratase/pimeloyl-ACP methyl ester carboxylesterase
MSPKEVFIGMALPPLRTEPIARKTLALFAGASGDHQPTHIDIDAARAKGRQDVIAHGMLMMAYLSRVLINWMPQERIRSYKARFVAMTPVHAVATCEGRVIAIEEGFATVELSICLADGTTVVWADAVVDIRELGEPREVDRMSVAGTREAVGASAEPSAANAALDAGSSLPPLVIRQQGSFAIGGTVLRSPGKYDSTRGGADGQTLHGDHAFVTYQVPVHARRHPLVYVHGNAQFSKTWQTTPDGREGFQNIFLRRGFSTYLVDSPRRGAAGRSTEAKLMTPTPEDQFWFDAFRVGLWPDYFPGVQFSRDPAVLDQYFRQITPDTGPFDVQVVSNAMAALFDKIGPAVLISHSQGGGVGWFTVIKSDNVRAVVSFEPGSNFPFPENEVPPQMPSAAGPLGAVGVPMAAFMRLTRVPIILFYGDYIPEQPTVYRGQDQWRVRLAMARRWAEVVNRHGGDVTVVRLPDVGLYGNTHFPFSDLNNTAVADEMHKFLTAKGLD